MSPPVDGGAAPLVSVIMPVFNGAEHLAEACRSVLRQSMTDLELIIVDDGSADDSEAKSREIAGTDARVRCLRLERNSGLPAVPRNVGIRAARGRFLAFIDHDDVWFTHKLARQLAVMRSDPDLAMVHSYLWGMERHSPWSGLRELCPPGEKVTSYERMLEGNQVQMSSVLIRADVVAALEGFSEADELRAVEDFELWLRVAHEYRIGYICEVHGLYRIRQASISRATNHRERLQYLDQSRGTRFLEPSGTARSRAVHRVAVMPIAVYVHLIDGAIRYGFRLRPRTV